MRLLASLVVIGSIVTGCLSLDEPSPSVESSIALPPTQQVNTLRFVSWAALHIAAATSALGANADGE